MTLYDWMPDLGHIGPLPISWLILIGFCFGVAAIDVFDPCAIAGIPVLGYATQIGLQAAGNSC